jgi:hypothetical protein
MCLLTAAATGFVVGRLGRGAQAAQSDPPPAPTPAPLSGTPQAPLVPAPPPALGTSEPYVPATALPEFDGGS